jgi:uncharacterized membrane protein YfcA
MTEKTFLKRIVGTTLKEVLATGDYQQIQFVLWQCIQMLIAGALLAGALLGVWLGAWIVRNMVSPI